MKNMEPKFRIYDNGGLHVSISCKNGKLGNIPQFNTLPGDEPLKLSNGQTLCNIKGTCGTACKDCKSSCYAVRAALYHNNSVIPAWGRNTVIMRNDPEKVKSEINEYCRKNIVKYFRFHTSGELESSEQLELYCDICNDNPDVIFYIYTKRFDVLTEYFLNHPVPDNFIVNLSEWHGNISDYLKNDVYEGVRGEVEEIFSKFNVFSYDDGNSSMEGLTHCPAIDKTGHETGVTCAQCRRCMKRGNKTAVYPH